MPVKLWGGRAVWSEFTAFCFQWICFVGASKRRIWERIMVRAKQINKTRLNFAKSAQEIHTMKK